MSAFDVELMAVSIYIYIYIYIYCFGNTVDYFRLVLSDFTNSFLRGFHKNMYIRTSGKEKYQETQEILPYSCSKSSIVNEVVRTISNQFIFFTKRF